MRGDTHTSKILVDLGINAVNVANNHILEHGSMLFILDELDRRGIIHVGSHQKSNLFIHPQQFEKSITWLVNGPRKLSW